MKHELRAEYGPEGKSGGVRTWHIVRTTDPKIAMCGRLMDEEAESKPESEWGTGLRSCQQCSSLYLHEAPHLEGHTGG